MQTAKNAIWYEWNALAFGKPLEDEMYGILCGLPETVTTEGSMFLTDRLFAYRRLLSAWGKVTKKDRTLYIDDVKLISSEQSGKIFFFVHNRAIDHICNAAENFNATNKRQWNWMRGLWGSCGSLYIPKEGYYLVLKVPYADERLERVKQLLDSAELKYSSRVKGSSTEIIMRDRQQIVDILGWIGFSNIVLMLEDRSILRETTNNRNRVLNCDMANICKTVETASKQLQIVSDLEKCGLFDKLPKQLKELAIARKENPEATLSELGKKLLRPIGKSTVEYRWKKIYNLASQIERGDGSHESWQG